MSQRTEKAAEYFLQGYNCAQSVLLAFADKYNLSEELASRLAIAFGGGMGRMREVCGTVSGMLIVAGLETKDPKDRATCYKITQDLINAFKEAQGTIYCKELLGLKNQKTFSPIPEERTSQYYAKRPCLELVKFAVELLEKKFGENE